MAADEQVSGFLANQYEELSAKFNKMQLEADQEKLQHAHEVLELKLELGAMKRVAAEAAAEAAAAAEATAKNVEELTRVVEEQQQKINNLEDELRPLLTNLLGQSLPPVDFSRARSDGSSTMVKRPITPKAVRHWRLTKERIRAELRAILGQLAEKRMTKVHERKDPPIFESGVNSQFYDQVCHVVNEALSQLPNNHFVVTDQVEAGQYGHKADFKVLDAATFQALKALGEGKRPAILARFGDIPTAWLDEESPLHHVIIQLYTYLVHEEKKVGFLTTYDRTWVVCIVHDVLYVSPAFSWDATSPSVREVLLWLVTVAAQDTYDLLGQQAAGAAAEEQQAAEEAAEEPQAPGQDRSVNRLGVPYLTTSEQRKQARGTSTSAPASGSATAVIERQIDASVKVLKRHEFLDNIRFGSVLGQEVVLKVCDTLKQSERFEAYQREVLAYEELQALQGTVLPKLVDHGYVDFAYVVAVSHVHGVHPSEYGPVPDELVEAAEQALRALHAAKYAHGDIRDSNILIERGTNRVVLLDLDHCEREPSPQDCEAELLRLRAVMRGSPRSHLGGGLVLSAPGSSRSSAGGGGGASGEAPLP